MIRKLVFIAFLICFSHSLPTEDRVSAPSGMINTTVYSGYLDTSKPDRKIHYVFVEAKLADPANNTAPLTIWLNGGPGCSSLIGFLQQIGPFLVGNNYKLGDLLNENPYSWNKVSNLLFLESPAIVGFSTDSDRTYKWTDEQTATDAIEAVKNFLFVKAPEFKSKNLYITGESYAGKYIPDLASKIIDHNEKSTPEKYINLKGIMVGNGVMSFQNFQLDKSEIEYMIDRSVVSNRLEEIYKHACSKNFESPRCQFFKYELDILQTYLNPYNVYEVCKDTPTEALRLKEALSAKRSVRNGQTITKKNKLLGQIPDCPSDTGLIQYLNLNKIPYKVDKVNKTWSVCSRLNYEISERGSMKEYFKILSNGGIKIWLFSGDWDDVVPFGDTEKNVDKIYREKIGQWQPWNVGDQHAGFYQLYPRNFTVITVKGAGHMVPQYKPKPSYQLIYNFVNDKGVNNQVF